MEESIISVRIYWHRIKQFGDIDIVKLLLHDAILKLQKFVQFNAGLTDYESGLGYVGFKLKLAFYSHKKCIKCSVNYHQLEI